MIYSVNVFMPHYSSLVMNGITSLRDGVDIYHTIQMLALLTFMRYFELGFIEFNG